jgi:hypothetical protein
MHVYKTGPDALHRWLCGPARPAQPSRKRPLLWALTQDHLLRRTGELRPGLFFKKTGPLRHCPCSTRPNGLVYLSNHSSKMSANSHGLMSIFPVFFPALSLPTALRSLDVFVTIISDLPIASAPRPVGYPGSLSVPHPSHASAFVGRHVLPFVPHCFEEFSILVASNGR